jgi:hypothetical protein
MRGYCPACSASFEAQLIHNGFNDSRYAYCSQCGVVALCDHWSWPAGIPTSDYGPLTPEAVTRLAPCVCGGQFNTHAQPRCPECRTALDPMAATDWIQAASSGTSHGWRWQRSWVGLYALVIEDRMVRDPWNVASSTR